MSDDVPDSELVYRLRHGIAHGMNPESMLAGAVADGMSEKRAAKLRDMLRHPAGTASAKWAALHAEMAEFGARKQAR